eukprot:5333853-Amphidinium_carterae.1
MRLELFGRMANLATALLPSASALACPSSVGEAFVFPPGYNVTRGNKQSHTGGQIQTRQKRLSRDC